MPESITNLRPGEHFTFAGFKWICLDPDYSSSHGVFAVMANIWKHATFNNDWINDYRKSNIRKALNGLLLPILGEKNLIPHEVDLLSDDGIDLYGSVTERVFILSCEEYRNYRRYMPTYNDVTWTCTPWTIDTDSGTGSSVRGVHTSGTIHYGNAGISHGVAPACILNPESLNLRRQAQVVSNDE